MFISPKALIGPPRHWPEFLPGPRTIAERAGIQSTKTFNNWFTGSHNPTNRNLSDVSKSLSSILDLPEALGPEKIDRFITAMKNSRHCGHWETTFTFASLGARVTGGQRPLPYSRNIIVPLERSAIRLMEAVKTPDRNTAVLGWLNAQSLAHFMNSSGDDDYEGARETAFQRAFIKGYVLSHVSGISALEAELNSDCLADPGPAAQKYMPVLVDGEIRPPMASFVSVLRGYAGETWDELLASKIAKKSKQTKESCLRNIKFWRAGDRLSWINIREAISAIATDDDINRLLLSFAVARYFQVVLNKLQAFRKKQELAITDEDIVRYFQEYPFWYSYHAREIGNRRAKKGRTRN